MNLWQSDTMHLQGMRFLVWGGANTLVTYLLFLVFALFLHPQAAYALVFLLGIAIAFFGNARWVFQSIPAWRMAPLYLLVYLCQYIINAGGLALLDKEYHFPPWLSLGTSMCISVPMGFLLNRFFFARHSERVMRTKICIPQGTLVLFGVLLGAVLYAPLLHGYWLGDDFANLRSAYRCLETGGWRQMLHDQFFRGVSEGGAFFRPLIVVSLYLNYLLAGKAYSGWILPNIVVHLCNGVLIWRVLLRLRRVNGQRTEATLPAELSAVLFLVSPFIAEGVYWVSARSDQWVTLFTLIGLLFWIGESHHEPNGSRLSGSYLLPIMLLPALLFKESATILPLQLTLIWFSAPQVWGRGRGWALIACYVLVVGFFIWRIKLFGDPFTVYNNLGYTAASHSLAGRIHALVSALRSLWPWLQGFAGNDTALAVDSICLLAFGLLACLAVGSVLTQGWRLPLAFTCAAFGLMLATLINLGGMGASGEGGRLFYSPMSWFLLSFGVALNIEANHRLVGLIRAVGILLAVVSLPLGTVLLHHRIEAVTDVQHRLEHLVADIPKSLSTIPGSTLLLVPDNVGPIVAVRNGQGGLVAPPLQHEDMLAQIIPTLDDNIGKRFKQYGDGLIAKLNGWPMPKPSSRLDSENWPHWIACMPSGKSNLVMFSAPSPVSDEDTWVAKVRSGAAHEGCPPPSYGFSP